ncbi:brefeldin A-inhibited guanine nucleotide-exchange protein 2 [Platysternon megacephalum]|uniref:Brefeldin A-inhibited guanine nucleotide-exchange protein 2 n=1 Tax=Platysternon megacephalum TaxID=55544 RepID=A0A4D9EQW4_9SAUR|nr:brefeldin A-inhibited guanine nucleotide-exchange protein 2 [Platysternon megacephalum]
MSAPSMEERKACWGARDEYWKCLDENMEDASRCQKLRCSFESRCPQQWLNVNELCVREEKSRLTLVASTTIRDPHICKHYTNKTIYYQ